VPGAACGLAASWARQGRALGFRFAPGCTKRVPSVPERAAGEQPRCVGSRKLEWKVRRRSSPSWEGRLDDACGARLPASRAFPLVRRSAAHPQGPLLTARTAALLPLRRGALVASSSLSSARRALSQPPQMRVRLRDDGAPDPCSEQLACSRFSRAFRATCLRRRRDAEVRALWPPASLLSLPAFSASPFPLSLRGKAPAESSSCTLCFSHQASLLVAAAEPCRLATVRTSHARDRRRRGVRARAFLTSALTGNESCGRSRSALSTPD